MIEHHKASLTWKMRQGSVLVSASLVLPAESASRLGSQLLREFAGRVMPPYELDVTGEIRKFSYRTDRMVLLIRRIRQPGERPTLSDFE